MASTLDYMALPRPEGYPGNLGCPFVDYENDSRCALVDLHDPLAPRSYSFKQLHELSNAIARGMLKAGLVAGDRIGILSRNQMGFVACLLGAMRAGIVPVPVNIKLAPETCHYILQDAGVKLVFLESSYQKQVPADISTITWETMFESFLDPGPFTAFEPDVHSVAIQPYTSGSTGRPKGVLLSHFGQNWSRRILAHTRKTTREDVILVAAPLYHKNALNAIKQGLTAGAKLILMPQFNTAHYIAAIGQYGCTVISGVPTMMSMMLAQDELLRHTQTAQVRTIMMGSAPSSAQLIHQLRLTFPQAEILVVYGVTEGGPVPLGPHPKGLPRPPQSIGCPYWGTEARLVHGPSPHEGELALKNPGTLLGYHNLPEETAKRIKDGWYMTGDICRKDEAGFFFFVGRTDDMFVCGGENIFPIEVESLLERHPSVHQAFVMPMDHLLKGSVPYAFVVLRKNKQASEEELKQFALAHGPVYQHPRRVFFMDQLPLAGTNKIDKAALKRIAIND
jgi:acyl-CoA synthetase (AMP-forming)/AMP-acid ligase II